MKKYGNYNYNVIELEGGKYEFIPEVAHGSIHTAYFTQKDGTIVTYYFALPLNDEGVEISGSDLPGGSPWDYGFFEYGEGAK